MPYKFCGLIGVFILMKCCKVKCAYSKCTLYFKHDHSITESVDILILFIEHCKNLIVNKKVYLLVKLFNFCEIA